MRDTLQDRNVPISHEESLSLDAVAITIILSIAVIMYVPWLGFYSDDWAYMAELSRVPDASVADRLHRVLQHDGVGRPSQFLLLAFFFQLFGPAPLGYHVANTVFIIGGALLFYCALREIGVGRQQSVATPLIFVMLPHYSATRFWVVTVFCTTLSMTCCAIVPPRSPYSSSSARASLSVSPIRLTSSAWVAYSDRPAWLKWSWLSMAAALHFLVFLPGYREGTLI